MLLTKRIRFETTLRHFNHRSKSREKLETAWKREILPGYFLRDDSRTIGCPAAFYASAKPTPRSPRNPLINPPPRNVRKIAIPPDTFALFLASLARTSVFPLLPFPNFFLPFSLPRNVSPPPIAAAQFGTHCQDPIELPTRNANFRRQEPQGLSFPLITLFPANWNQLRHLRARARFN